MAFGRFPERIIFHQKSTQISLLEIFLTSEINFMQIGRDFEILLENFDAIFDFSFVLVLKIENFTK